MKKVILLFLLFFTFVACSSNEDSKLSDEIEIYFINAGQGDCTFIKGPNGKNLLIDASKYGYGTDYIVPFLKSIGVDSIQYVIATHFHEDHMGGLAEVLDSLPLTRKCYDRGGSCSWWGYDAAVAGKVQAISKGDTFTVDDGITVKCYASNGNDTGMEDENSLSVAVVISFGDFDLFAGGDIESIIEDDIKDEVPEVEMYKVSHHCSSTSSSVVFMEKIRPLASVMEIGYNSYGHPHEEAYANIENVGSDIYQTGNADGEEVDGTVKVVTDGRIFTITTTNSHRDKTYEVK